MVLTGQLYVQGQLTSKQQTVQQMVIKMFNALSNRDSINLKAFGLVRGTLLVSLLQLFIDFTTTQGLSLSTFVL